LAEYREVLKRLSRGESRRSIARELEMCRGTVDSMAAGKWRPKQPLDALCDPAKSEPVTLVPAGETVRCPTCRAKLTQLPCVLCSLPQPNQERRRGAA
jgi:hypothetical protein